MTSQTYPSGRVVQTEYDAAGRLAGVKNQATALFWAGATATDSANRIQYSAHGAATATKLGNGRWEHTNFNSRLQPLQIGLGTSATNSSLLQLDYGYNSSCQPNNNGNVLTQTITIGATVMSQGYCYDALNRLQTASENTGATWSQTYGYDRFGNRWVSASTGYTLSSLTPQSQGAFNAANNRLIASGYDSAGNQTTDAQSRTFTYDAENRQTTFNGTTGQYFYDGDGRRVKKIDGSGTTVFVYNAGGQLIAEYHSDPVPLPAGGGGTSYLTSDHLGSTRVVTKADGTVKARYDYLPFGEELGATVGQRTTAMGYSLADSTKQKFTSKERDSESGLDYFLARYYSSAQGRFTSADPKMISSWRLVDPQQFNLFAYTRNNPFKFYDPDGRDVRLANAGAGARVKAQEAINKNLTPREAQNIGVTPRSHQLFVRNPNAIGNQSEAYNRLVGLIGNRNLHIDVHVAERGTTVTTRDGLEGTYQEYASRGGQVLHIDQAKGKHGVVVPEGDGPSVKGVDGQMVVNPDYIVMGHELLGETFKLMPGNQNLLNNANADSQSVIDFDNSLRRMHGLPLRSGEDHGPWKANVSAHDAIIEKVKPDPSLFTRIPARKIP